MKLAATHAERRRRRRGVSLIETVLSLLILGGAFVALLNTVASARGAQATAAERQFAYVLAEDLMSEILAQNLDQEDTTIGPELTEALAGNRSGFDDVDDYDGWRASPPVDRDGVAIPGSSGYTRSVSIKYSRLANPEADAPTDEGVLRIDVTIKRGDKQIVSIRALRTDVWHAPQEGY